MHEINLRELFLAVIVLHVHKVLHSFENNAVS